MHHLILVFCAYTFILWYKLTGGLRRQWANQPLNTFTVDALAAFRRVVLEAFRTAMSFRFLNWFTQNQDVFTAYKASLGLIFVELPLSQKTEQHNTSDFVSCPDLMPLRRSYEPFLCQSIEIFRGLAFEIPQLYGFYRYL